MSKRFALLVCFLIKESTILGASLICLVLAVLGLLLFPFAWLSMKCAASHSHHGYTHAAYVRFAIEMVNVVSDQLGVLFVLMLNSSSMYQVFVTLYRNVVLGSIWPLLLGRLSVHQPGYRMRRLHEPHHMEV